MESIFNTDLMHWVVFSLGATNLITGLGVFSCCRVFPRFRVFAPMTNSAVYKSFFRHHGVMWQVFWGSVVVHMTLGVLHAGLPWMH